MSDNDLIRRSDALKALDWRDIYGRNAQAAVEAIPAAQPTVKPLVWERHPMGWVAGAMFGPAYIIDVRIKSRVMFIKGMNPSPQFDDLEAAKAAAQADYEARILSALTTGKEVMPNDDGNSNARPATSPGVTAGAASPDVAAMVEAAEKVISSYWYSSDGIITGMHDLAAALARVKGETK